MQAGRPLVMGIVNAGADSFSDAVRLDTLDAQVARALELVAEGADLIDVGGRVGRHLHGDVRAPRTRPRASCRSSSGSRRRA